MKKIFQLVISMGIFLPLIFTACKKEELKIYEDASPAIRLGLYTYSYSFIDDIGADSKLIYIPVRLSGKMKDYDRKFTMGIVADTNSTAKPEWIEIQEGILPKNSIEGRIPILLKRNATLETSMATIKVRLLPSNELSIRDWPQVDISWTSQIIKPINWDSWLRYYFGTPFSTGYYKFIVKVTGQSSFPYHGTLAKTDPVTWWMGAGQVQAYALQVKDSLMKYNVLRPDSVLVHNDGPYKGLAVTLP